ncbi:GNAT family N-acetyltransferase [Streptomyces formicae]|uniref:GCN5-related N-acetyltransferase n=1 Tax=Streptomyces formicae TaxID=1616117 RepID=A0A291QJ46_9ACTN|nr:GNAT family N-acetyltransferase [Streptomyces formicae]ATL31547.1 GCN5-related N-acetyltransferase [Streptomyces formicae]
MHTRPPLIRPVTAAELPLLQDIERAAGEPFRALGMASIADDEPPAVEDLDRFRRAGRAWVAVDEEAGAPIAYLISEPVEDADAEHIEQVSVHPRAARRGVGGALIEHTARHARAAGRSALTLTTFADVPWNAPYYARIGFRPLAPAELTPELRAIRAHEAELGLDRWPRLCMRRDLTSAGRTAP